MNASSGTILTINGGSSSIKFALFKTGDSLDLTLTGEIERIGLSNAAMNVKATDSAESFSRPVAAPNHASAVNFLMDWIDRRSTTDRLCAVGHRVLQGGPKYYKAQLITVEMLAEIHRLSPFDPDHIPVELELIQAFSRRYPRLAQFACFDTAFHHDMPRMAQLIAIPRRYEAQGVRRYGFHGLSFSYLIGELAREADDEAALDRVILAHLGNGASLAAVNNGRSFDTSMGFTPASGVPMGTRSGDLDPGLLDYLSATEKMTAGDFNKMVNTQSGLLGISETSSDMRDLLACEAQDIRAAEAVNFFCYEVKKWIGAFAAALGGVETLVFAGGIGENSPVVRARICEGLEFLGMELDGQANSKNSDVISTDDRRVSVRVIHTNENLMIARTVNQLLNVEHNKEK